MKESKRKFKEESSIPSRDLPAGGRVVNNADSQGFNRVCPHAPEALGRND